MTLVSSVWREVTQKLGLLKALIGFCTIAGEESKRKAEPRTRSASRLSLAEMKRFELLRRGTPDLPHFECGPFSHLGTSPDFRLQDCHKSCKTSEQLGYISELSLII